MNKVLDVWFQWEPQITEILIEVVWWWSRNCFRIDVNPVYHEVLCCPAYISTFWCYFCINDVVLIIETRSCSWVQNIQNYLFLIASVLWCNWNGGLLSKCKLSNLIISFGYAVNFIIRGTWVWRNAWVCCIHAKWNTQTCILSTCCQTIPWTITNFVDRSTLKNDLLSNDIAWISWFFSSSGNRDFCCNLFICWYCDRLTRIRKTSTFNPVLIWWIA